MSLHIQMSEEAETQRKKAALRNQLSSILTSLAVMGGGAALLFSSMILILKEAPSAFIAYNPPAENLPPSAAPSMAELSPKSSSPSSAVTPILITSTSPAPLQMRTVDIEAGDIEINSGIDVSMGLGAGLGDGLGDGGIGLDGGRPGGSALVGTFYDLKLTRTGAKSKLAPPEGSTIPDRAEMSRIYHEFTKGWSPSVLNKYYQSPTKLYATNFYLPHCKADYGPMAYQCDLKKNKPAGWVAVYRGRVKAPKSGTFRFVGTGDDVLCVRFNRKTVLEAGWCIPSLYEKEPGSTFSITTETERGRAYMKAIREGKDKDHKDYEYYAMPHGWSLNQVGGLTCGTPFEVKAGQVYPMEIMISEGPGGALCFFLLMEDMTDNPQSKLPAAQRRYDLFRTNFSLPNQEEIRQMLQKANCLWHGQMNCPPYNEDSPIWVVVP